MLLSVELVMNVRYFDINELGFIVKPIDFKIKISSLSKNGKTYSEEEVRKALESIRNWLD